MSLGGHVDSSGVQGPVGHLIEEAYVHGVDNGSPIRQRKSGLAFELGFQGPIAVMQPLDSPVRVSPKRLGGSPLAEKRRGDASEKLTDSPLTTDEIQEKLVAAQARRAAAINELRNKCKGHNENVEKIHEMQSVAERHQKEDLQEQITKELETARINVDEMRQAHAEKLKLQEIRRQEIMNMKHAEFEERVRKLDAKFTDKDGNRDKVLAEIVDKLKEHNERVKIIRETKEKETANSAVDANHPEWIEATTQQEEYIRSAKDRVHQGNFDLHEMNSLPQGERQF